MPRFRRPSLGPGPFLFMRFYLLVSQLILMSLLVAGCSQGDAYLDGEVVDAQTGAPIADVIFEVRWIDDANLVATGETDQQGRFVIAYGNEPPPRNRVVFVHPVYQVQSFDIPADAIEESSARYKLKVRLNPSASAP